MPQKSETENDNITCQSNRRDLTNRLPLAIEAAQLCYQLGGFRHLERMFNLQHYLDRMSQDFVNASANLRDVLNGPTEYFG